MRFAVVIFLCVPLLAGCGKDASHTATPGAKLNVPMVLVPGCDFIRGSNAVDTEGLQ